MKILFMGTPDFAKQSLKSIYEAGYEILGVVTNPDRPQGRGMKMIPSDVKKYALEKNLKIYQPQKVKNNSEFIEEIKELNPDLICVVAYGKILPKEILDIPKYGCINVHGSLLPKYRGAAPIQWAIMNGDKTTGITTMYMDVGMDTGDMILKEEVEILDNETTGELWIRLSEIGGKLLVETIKQIKEGNAPRIKQGEDFSMAPMLDKSISKIDWNKLDSNHIKNLVRGLNPIMGTYSFLNGKKIKIWKVDIVSQDEIEKLELTLEGKENGTILLADDKKGLYTKTLNGVISILEIQGENSKKMSVFDFLRGNKIEKNTIFE